MARMEYDRPKSGGSRKRLRGKDLRLGNGGGSCWNSNKKRQRQQILTQRARRARRERRERRQAG